MIKHWRFIWDGAYAPLALQPRLPTASHPFPVSKVLRTPRFLDVFLYMMYDVA